MSLAILTPVQREKLPDMFGENLQYEAPLARYTSARIGGLAEALVTVRSADELAHAAGDLWSLGVRFLVLGGGSNVLVSDEGVGGVVLLNRARDTRFLEVRGHPKAIAESGAGLGTVARLAAERGWSGLEWAATVPGTVGGAVVGNAGAHGGDIAGSLDVAEILQHEGKIESWPEPRLGFGYRTSNLKAAGHEYVVLSATFKLQADSVEACKKRMREFADQRERTQPSGASMGSMFKNPEGDYAGRLIEAAGLKGRSHGGVMISDRHANFFINHGEGTAADVLHLITTARQAVLEQFGVVLELEIEFIGNWSQPQLEGLSSNGTSR